MKARIIKIVSKEYTLLTDQNERLDAIVMGKVRKQDAPVAGDLVETEFVNGRWVIQKILPRHNRLIRPAVANVDQALIIMSVKDPDFSPALIDRLSILIMHAGIRPILCVTKCDLGISPDFEERIREYEAGEMQVIRTAKGSRSERRRQKHAAQRTGAVLPSGDPGNIQSARPRPSYDAPQRAA